MTVPQFHEAKRNVLVVALDAARARLFWVESSQSTRAQRELREDEVTFVHPGARLRTSERYTDSFPGGVRSGSGQHFGYDDHQNQKDTEERRRFAREVADGLERIVRDRGVDQLVLAASHAEHAPLVAELEKRKLGCELRHTALEVTRLSPPELYRALSERELLR